MTSQTIRAAICHEFGAPLSIGELRLRAPEMGEVEVTLEAVAICHSDITYADGGFGGALPAVYGHEAAGRISAVGAGVRDLAPGDTVAVTLIRACGQCRSCGSGHPTTCETPRRDAGPLSTPEGETVFQALNCGAFAEKVVVDQSQVVAIPADMPMDLASLLSCGVITGVGAAVNAAGIRPGHDVVVVGAGGVGLNAIQGARIAGARRIVAIDMTEEKLEAAREFGATDGVLGSTEKPWRAVKEILGRGADAVLVTVGATAAYDAAPRYLANGGKVVMVGMPHGTETSRYSPLMMADVGQGIIGTKMGDVVIRRDIPWMIDLWQQGRLKLEELVSGRWGLEEINEAIADTRSGAARRNVIVLGR